MKKSLLTLALRTPQRSMSIQNLMHQLENIHIPPTYENRILIKQIIRKGSRNNLRHILNTYNLNMNQYTAFENAWVTHILKNAREPQLRHVIHMYSKRLSPRIKSILEKKWVQLLVQSGSVNAIQNALKYNLNNRNRTVLTNVLPIRKLHVKNLERLVQLPLGKPTLNAFRREIQLRSLLPFRE